RRDPIFRGCLEGTLPGSYSENSVMSSVQRAAIAWNILTGAGIPGIRDVYVHPITNGVNVCVKITKHYQGQPKQIAAALWGNSAAQYRYKHVWVVEDDIDIASYEQIDCAAGAGGRSARARALGGVRARRRVSRRIARQAPARHADDIVRRKGRLQPRDF